MQDRNEQDNMMTLNVSNAESKGKEIETEEPADKKCRKKHKPCTISSCRIKKRKEKKKKPAAQIIFWLKSNSSLIVLPSIGDLSSRLWKLTGGPFGMVMLS